MGIPERLVEIREKNGYTRKRLSDELGRPYRTITKYETGEREPGHSYIVEIARKFGISTDYILGVSSSMTTSEKNSSGTDKSAPEEQVSRIFDNLTQMLVSEGLIIDGNNLTEKQADVLIAVSKIIKATFKD